MGTAKLVGNAALAIVKLRECARSFRTNRYQEESLGFVAAILVYYTGCRRRLRFLAAVVILARCPWTPPCYIRYGLTWIGKVCAIIYRAVLRGIVKLSVSERIIAILPCVY